MGRFFRVTPTPVQSQFVELPLEFMYGQLQAKQGEYDQAAALNEQLKGLYDIKVHPNDIPDLMKRQEEYFGQIDEVARNLERSGDVNQALYEVQDIKRKLAQDKFHRYAPERYTQIQKDEEAYQKGVQKGNVDPYNQLYKGYVNDVWKKTLNEKGELNPYDPGPLYYENANHMEEANKLMGTIIPDSVDWKKSSYDGNAFKITTAGGREVITEADVRQLAKDKAGTFLQNPTVGADFIRKMQYKYGDQLTEEILRTEAEELLYTVAEEQIHSKIKSERGVDFDEGYYKYKEETKPVILPTSDIPIDQNLTAKQTSDKIVKHVEDNYSFDKDGSLVSKTMSDSERVVYEREKKMIEEGGREKFAILWGQDALAAYDRKDQLAAGDNQKMDGFKQIRKTFEVIEPSLKDKSDKEVFDIWTNGIKNMTEVGSYQKDYGSQYADALRGQVMSNLPDREVVIMGGKHSNEGSIFNGKDLETNVKIKTKSGSKKLSELSQEELKDAVVFSGETYGVFNKEGESKPYYTATINTTEGPVKVGIQMNNEQANMYTVSNKVASNIVSGNSGYFIDAFTNNKTEKIVKYNENGDAYTEEMIPIVQITGKGGGQVDPGYIPVFRGTDGKIKAYGTNGEAINWEGSDEYKSKLIRDGKIDVLDQREFNEEQYNSFQRSNIMFNNSRKANTNKIELGEQ